VILLKNIVDHLSYNLFKNNITAKIMSRIKDPISIVNKLQKKGVGLEQLTDIYAFRIIVANKAECFKALKVVHNLYEYDPSKFKNFIDNPKDNGYQSLHTVILISQPALKAEVQIRDREMHHHAEYGAAAHAKYKNTTSKELQELYNNVVIIAQAYEILRQPNWTHRDLITYEQAIEQVIKNIYFPLK
jgi:(p)ppGpp synthase/HD superfamily hydrolase